MRNLLIILILGSNLLWAGTTYYVDNTQSATGNGSFDQPFTTITQAMSVATAGDTILIRGNVGDPTRTYSEELYLGSSDASGTAQAPILMKAYPGENVRIVLASSFSIYTSYWIFEDLIFDMDGKSYDTIKLKGDNVTFRRCEVTNGQKDGFDISGASNTLIEDCKIHYFVRNDQYDAHGIILDGGVDNVFRNNEIYDCKGDCIQLYKTEQNYGTIIEGNNLYTTLGSNSENAIDVKAARNLTIRNNKMHGFHDSPGSDGVALKINKDSDNIVVYGNDIFESNGGIRVSGGNVDTIYIERNVIHDFHVDGGDSSKYGYGIQFDGVNYVRLTNNTFAHIPGPLFWIASGGVNDIRIENNLFYDTNKFKGSTADFRDPVFVDYNGWFKCQETISGPNDVTGDDPLFIDDTAYDYHLQEGSPAIDKGNPATGSDFPGRRVDLGAFEFEPTTSFLELPQTAPDDFELFKCYPNPFNPTTVLEYKLNRAGQVRLEVFNILGQKVDTLIQQFQNPGIYRLRWTAQALPAGIYFARLQVNHKVLLRSLVLLK